MKIKFILFTFLILLGMLSCKEAYDAHTGTDLQVPVVEAYLGNIAGASYVSLSIASLYNNSAATPKHIQKAQVYLTDNNRNIVYYREKSAGYYVPVNPSFAGEINKTYTLTITTPDGLVYISKPQAMLPVLSPKLVSGAYNIEESLVKDYTGVTTKTVKDILEVYYDFDSDHGITPRFRFTSTQLILYRIDKELKPPFNGVSFRTFFCWMTTYDNSLRFTNEKYPNSSGEVTKQTVCITAPDRLLLVPDMDPLKLAYMDTLVTAFEQTRIIRINQYRLNPDAYTFYKGVESQSAAEGKMFDPITSQLYGNMKCKTDTTLLVLGFFEVSPLSTKSYIVSRSGVGTPITFKNIPDVNPPFPMYFKVDTIPDFWIY